MAKGVARKLQEIRYATAIEKQYSKNDILIGYLNLVNFGGTTYGMGEETVGFYILLAATMMAARRLRRHPVVLLGCGRDLPTPQRRARRGWRPPRHPCLPGCAL